MPTFIVASYRSGPVSFNASQPGMHWARIFGSNNTSQTFCLGALKVCVPSIFKKPLLLIYMY